jgi:hypothetical protein
LDEDDLSDRGGRQRVLRGSVPRLLAENGGPDGDQSPAATRITLRPHDPRAGEEIEKTIPWVYYYPEHTTSSQWALLNEVLSARMVSYPFTGHDCCLITDGAAR